MIGSSRDDVACAAGCGALVCVEVGRDGRARGFGHCCAPRPCAGEREALGALAALSAGAVWLAASIEVGREAREDR